LFMGTAFRRSIYPTESGTREHGMLVVVSISDAGLLTCGLMCIAQSERLA